jgi:hypothetical protein
MHFTSFRQHMKRVYNLFTPSPLEVLIPSQPCPRFPSPEPGGEGELADGEVEHGVANKCRDKRLGSPRGDWRWQLGRRGRRRAAAATQGQHGRGCAKSGEGTCGAEQCVAHRASGGRLPRRSGPWGGRGERARRGAARRDVVRCRRSGSKLFQVPHFELNFLQISKQNCTKV